jgi:transposase-like protein
VSEVALEAGVSRQSLHAWVRRYRTATTAQGRTGHRPAHPVSATGVIVVCRQHVALGRVRAGRIVTVHVSEHTLAIELGGETRSVRRTTSRPVVVIKANRPHRPRATSTELSASPDQAD